MAYSKKDLAVGAAALALATAPMQGNAADTILAGGSPSQIHPLLAADPGNFLKSVSTSLRAAAPEEPLAGPVAGAFIQDLRLKLANQPKTASYFGSPRGAIVAEFSVMAVVPGAGLDAPVRVCAQGMGNITENGQTKRLPVVKGTWTLNDAGTMIPDNWTGSKVAPMKSNGTYGPACTSYLLYYRDLYNQAAIAAGAEPADVVAATGSTTPRASTAARLTGPQ